MKSEKRAIMRNAATLILVLGGSIIATACGSSSPAATPVASVSTPGAVYPATPTQTGGSSASNTPASGTNSNLDCRAIANAAFDFNSSEPVLVILSKSGGSAQNIPGSSLYVDTAKLRADLDVLTALPDPTNAAEITVMGKPSDAIREFRVLLDAIDNDATLPTPGDGTPATTDQKLIDAGADFIKMSTAINAALADACPNSSPDLPPAPTPAT